MTAFHLSSCVGRTPEFDRLRTATLDAAIPWLYLKGVSSGQMQSALEAIVGPQAKGLSSNVVGRRDGGFLFDA